MTYMIWVDGKNREATEDELQQIQVDLSKRLIWLSQDVRNFRNSKLAACDWTQCKDVSNVISQKWAVYRQNLRDVPQQSGFPENVIWPTEPQ